MRVRSSYILWLAQGFGSGRAPVAPGTFGSVVGMLWFAVLVQTGNAWLFFAGSVAGLAASVWLCGEGERILGRKDPGSVVMDEIAAIPICFAGWVIVLLTRTGVMPPLEAFFGKPFWPAAVVVFLLFRLFDVTKPWPVRQSQLLPGGWGVTVDDALAAVYVNVVVLIAHAIKPGFF